MLPNGASSRHKWCYCETPTAPPHFHAEYAEFEARVAIETLAVLSGNLPARAMGLVEWATLHRQELQAQWQHASGLDHGAA